MAVYTQDKDVFSFYPDGRPCNGFEEALSRYREIVPGLNLSGFCLYTLIFYSAYFFLVHSWSQVMKFSNGISHPFVTGPTSFAPVIDMAVTIVEQNGGQYHVLLIIADGQVLFFG